MAWTGDFVFGRGWAAFRGRSADNSFHAHATVQLTLAGQDEVAIRTPEGEIVRGPAVVVRPGMRHALAETTRATLVHLEPQTAMARRVLDGAGDAPVSLAAPDIAAAVEAEGPLAAVLDRLRAMAPDEPRLDPRLAAAMAFLAEAPGGDAVARAATRCGLSVSRLRALAQAELGASLSTWLMWRKLERAGQALASGTPLAEAALAGDFADQAHFTRAMRRAFGVTPRTAGEVVRGGQANGSRPGRRDRVL